MKSRLESSPDGLSSLLRQHGIDYTDYAKLMVWSFVAGFQERFVTGFITDLADRARPTGDDGAVAKPDAPRRR